MKNFTVSPFDCLILKAFKDSRSLREAAQLLGCDPAGLARKAQSISSRDGLLQKVNNRWQVTKRGMDLVAWVESSMQHQEKVLSAKDGVRIGTTMWFAEEIIVPHLARLIALFEEKLTVSVTAPQGDFEMALIEGSVDYVIVCHPPESPEIEHRKIAEEKWVVIAPKSWRFKEKNILEALKKRPFIRHSSINLDLFLPDASTLIESGIVIDHMIGIRSAVREGLGWSIVPKILVDRAHKDHTLEILSEVPIPDRKICLWWLRNRYDIKRQSTKIGSWLKDATQNEIL